MISLEAANAAIRNVWQRLASEFSQELLSGTCRYGATFGRLAISRSVAWAKVFGYAMDTLPSFV